jgi:TRAP-type C4-dicarboxylate transport system substrate-binding protein
VKAWMPRNFVIVNKGVWTGLSKEKQDVLIDCSAKAEAAGLDKSKAADAEALSALKTNGMKVLQPSEKFAAELAKIGQQVAAEWITKAGEPGTNIIARYTKTN